MELALTDPQKIPAIVVKGASKLVVVLRSQVKRLLLCKLLHVETDAMGLWVELTGGSKRNTAQLEKLYVDAPKLEAFELMRLRVDLGEFVDVGQLLLLRLQNAQLCAVNMHDRFPIKVKNQICADYWSEQFISTYLLGKYAVVELELDTVVWRHPVNLELNSSLCSSVRFDLKLNKITKIHYATTDIIKSGDSASGIRVS